jgi:hypothetical protein
MQEENRKRSWSVGKKSVWGWNIHPAEILREEFLKPMGISVYELAQRIHLTRSRVTRLCESGALSQRIRPYAWRGFSERPRSFG